MMIEPETALLMSGTLALILLPVLVLVTLAMGVSWHLEREKSSALSDLVRSLNRRITDLEYLRGLDGAKADPAAERRASHPYTAMCERLHEERETRP